MTDTTTLAPTDAEILDAAEDFRSQYTHGGTTFDEFDEIGFTRSVLAKWGTPAPVGVEPVAWAATSTDGVVEALGMNQSRRFDTPLFAAPPAQEARVPLSDGQIEQGHDAADIAPTDATIGTFTDGVRFAEKHHGITAKKVTP